MKPNGSILIVDDDPECVEALTSALQADGWDVSAAGNGASALASVESRTSLILLGLHLPIVDGLEVCRTLKSNQATRNIPIILISPAGNLKDTVRGLALGALDYMEKPFHGPELPLALRTHLELERVQPGLAKRNSKANLDVQRVLMLLHAEATDRRRAEAILREHEEWTSLALRAGRSLAFEWNPKTDELRSAPGQIDLDAPIHTWSEFLKRVHAEDRENLINRIQELTPASDTCECDYRVAAPGGSIAYQHGTIRGIFDQNGRPERYVGITGDSAGSRHVDAALESEERFRQVADTAPMMICASGPDMQATYFNNAWLQFAGRTMEEEVGYGWTARLHEDDLERTMANYSASFAARRKCHLEYRLRRANGDYRWIVCSGLPRWSADGVFAGYLASCIDFTDLKRAQEEAFDKQKVESLRAVTGGIAHDFNNLLGGILVQADLTESEIAEGVSPMESIGRIKKLATHASEIVRELLIYSGQDKATLEPVNVSAVVDEMAELLKASISKHAKLETELVADLPPVLGSTTQIRQIIMNLILNASEAIGDKGGMIRIATSKQAGLGHRRGSPGSVAGDDEYVRLEVADTGRGMTTEAKGKIFDPFFTTKPAGHGLGLAVVQGIVRSHGGEINVTSVPGFGTTFEVLLPYVGNFAVSMSASEATMARGSQAAILGTILLVEEDETFRISIGKALRRKGYAILAAGEGNTALDVFRTRMLDVDAIVLSVTPDGCPASDVLSQVRRVREDIPVVLTWAGENETHGLKEQPGVALLKKPFRIGDLLARLHELGWKTKVPATGKPVMSDLSRRTLVNRGSGSGG